MNKTKKNLIFLGRAEVSNDLNCVSRKHLHYVRACYF